MSVEARWIKNLLGADASKLGFISAYNIKTLTSIAFNNIYLMNQLDRTDEVEKANTLQTTVNSTCHISHHEKYPQHRVFAACASSQLF